MRILLAVLASSMLVSGSVWLKTLRRRRLCRACARRPADAEGSGAPRWIHSTPGRLLKLGQQPRTPFDDEPRRELG